jgi:hypothetical protein
MVGVAGKEDRDADLPVWIDKELIRPVAARPTATE